MRQQDKDLTLEEEEGVMVGQKVEGGGWRGARGLDGQLHNSAEAELSLKNGAWPISKGQSPEH